MLFASVLCTLLPMHSSSAHCFYKHDLSHKLDLRKLCEKFVLVCLCGGHDNAMGAIFASEADNIRRRPPTQVVDKTAANIKDQGYKPWEGMLEDTRASNPHQRRRFTMPKHSSVSCRLFFSRGLSKSGCTPASWTIELRPSMCSSGPRTSSTNCPQRGLLTNK